MTPSACSSSTAARCARCCARWRRTRSRTSPPCWRSTGPDRWRANAHIDYADRKNGRKQIESIHPELTEPLAEILSETYGLVVYQEQVQAIARKVAGYTLGQADLLRRAMGKKKKAELDAQLENFTAGMQANGFSQSAINALWGTLLPFCDYGFNKSHTAGYGLVSYWTAYLKANYPAEYMAALLDLGQGRQGQDGRLPGRMPADGHQGAAAVRELLRCQLHPDRHRHPVRPDRGAQRGLERGRLGRGHPQSRRASSPTSPISCARSTPWSATSGRSRR